MSQRYRGFKPQSRGGHCLHWIQRSAMKRGMLLLLPLAHPWSLDLKVLSSRNEPRPLTNLWGRGVQPNATSSLPQTPQKALPGGTLLTAVLGEGLLGTRLTCPTVGIRVPGFLVKYQGALGSNQSDESRNFAVRREIVDMFSTAPFLPCGRLSHCFKECGHQWWLGSKLHELNSFLLVPKVIQWKMNAKTSKSLYV